ncbi:MAG TPA: aromatic ring-hydroxylating dioxygenase subunit alpha [Terriglobales bacterium]|nr:aromatic ring-hydroxylating dioxygenase subunit alpha [Terriglobales bacterium]
MITQNSVRNILDSYDDHAALSDASTIPAPWYVDDRIAELENRTVFSKTWQMVGRTDQVEKPGQFVTAVVAGEPIVVVRGNDGVLRGFFNVCRHHAAAVVTEACGQASILHCPYHGWNYGLDGSLKGMPEFDGVKNFERQQNGLLPVRAETWEKFVFINLDPNAEPLTEFLGGLVKRVAPLGVSKLHFFDTRTYDIHCNWKVFIDNYLDGGYHVPHLHKGLSSVLDYKEYTIENEDRYCLQSSPMVSSDEDAATGATRKGDRAWYFWQYPNLMINCYEGYMDTNLVIPIDVDHCRVVFDFYFSDVSEKAQEYNRQSVAVGARVQDEDLGICEAVQRGLKSRAYGAGRLSVRREAGEHLFHRLLAADLKAGLSRTAAAAD